MVQNIVKVIKPAEKTDLANISLTGIRAICILGFLLEAPRSVSEIKELFVKYNIMDKSRSDDIIRIDINTLKKFGCIIEKGDRSNNFKYTLIQHPFRPNINQQELSILKKAYRKVKDSADINSLLLYDELFRKLTDYVREEDLKNYLYGISILKYYDTGIIQELLEDCKYKRQLKLSYLPPYLKEPVEKDVVAQRLFFQNNKIYLFAYDLKIQKTTVLNLKRVMAVLSRLIGDRNVETKTVNIKFFVKDFGVNDIELNEKIIETNDQGFIVEGSYYNEFFAIQRMLSFGSDCIVIEPEDIKQKIIQKLERMRDIYND